MGSDVTLLATCILIILIVATSGTNHYDYEYPDNESNHTWTTNHTDDDISSWSNDTIGMMDQPGVYPDNDNIHTRSNDTLCNQGEFHCTSGECIPGHYRCNDDPECEDESDENDCSKYRSNDTIGMTDNYDYNYPDTGNIHTQSNDTCDPGQIPICLTETLYCFNLVGAIGLKKDKILSTPCTGGQWSPFCC